MRHRTALLCSVLVVATAVAAGPGPATAAAPGFQVQIIELPGRFTVGPNPSIVTVVASTAVGRQCRKMRWSMLVRVNGLALDQVNVERVEQTGSFPLAVQADGDTVRLTDVQLDPGRLCPDRTVTARYEVSFDRTVTDGEVTLQAEAYDTTQRLLERATVTRKVVNDRTAEASPTPSAEPEPTENDATDETSAEATEGAAADETSAEATDGAAADEPDGLAAVPAAKAGEPSMLGAGLIIGAVLIFLGVGLLLRLRLRNRQADTGGPAPPHPV